MHDLVCCEKTGHMQEQISPDCQLVDQTHMSLDREPAAMDTSFMQRAYTGLLPLTVLPIDYGCRNKLACQGRLLAQLAL